MPERAKRVAYLDNLRSLALLLVVVMHSNVTYSGLGSWYYTEGSPERLGFGSLILFAFYGCFVQAWSMGVLFFLAGVNAASGLARKGVSGFIRERVFRLGAPLLLYMLVIHPLVVYVFWDHGRLMSELSFVGYYRGFLSSGRVFSATGPMWFAQALLFFCLAYGGFRALCPRAVGRAGSPPPGLRTSLGLAGLTGLAAFGIRLVWPIGSSVMNLQLCFFASYIVLFVLGLRAAERGWFERLPELHSVAYALSGLVGGFALWSLVMVLAGALEGMPRHFEGGYHLPAAAYAFWEAFVAIAMSLGLVGVFRRHAAWDNRFTRLLARNNFRLYLFHTPVLVGISVALAGWQAPLLLKHLVVAPAACIATIALSEIVLRRIPGLAAISR